MGEPSYKIVPMGETHLMAVHRLEKACFPDPWSILAFRAEVRRQRYGGYSRVLTVDGEVRAYLVAGFVADEGHLANIAVAPSDRRRGFARSLLDDLLAAARWRGTATVWLEVRVGNHGAIRLYESYGFESISIRKNYYAREGEDALVMCLRLPVGGEEQRGLVR